MTRQNQLLLANIWKEAGLRVSSDHSHWSEMPDMQKEEGGSERGGAEGKEEEEEENDTDKRKNNCE